MQWSYVQFRAYILLGCFYYVVGVLSSAIARSMCQINNNLVKLCNEKTSQTLQKRFVRDIVLEHHLLFSFLLQGTNPYIY